jgi:hypothetical protein
LIKKTFHGLGTRRGTFLIVRDERMNEKNKQKIKQTGTNKHTGKKKNIPAMSSC